ncbi:site-specific DNA-methyltransferase [bacterium]|nr:MAG: site-specific DNA-methyltransferase [bacterium]
MILTIDRPDFQATDFVFPDHLILNMDCVPGMATLPANSVRLVVTSIPFGSLFTYSGKNEDIGNNQDGVDLEASMFGLHMRFFAEQLLRVMMPGRNVCIHIQQLLRYKNQHGYMGRRDFRGSVVDIFERAGFEWKGEVAIPKNPQIIAKRLSLHSLMFITGKKDACQLAPAVNDYVMIFQKPGDNPEPVRALFDRHENPDGWVTTDEWIKWASGCWDDIRETDVLENYDEAREANDEKHVCPLQLEVIRRCVKLYSKPGDLVMDPFMGIGSTAWVAIEQGRKAVGFELKESYHALAVRNAERATGNGLPQGRLDWGDE